MCPGRPGRSRAPRVLALAALALAVGSAAAGAQDLLPHRAVYDLSLGSPRGEGGIADLQGRMAVEFVDVCDGWTVDQRMVLDITYEGEAAFRSYSSFASWESRDGTRFRFEDRTWHDDGPVEEIGGEARLEATDGAGSVTLAKPAPATFPLPAGTMFPTRHTAFLIERARAGEAYVLRPTFDGTSADGAIDVGAALGRPRPVSGGPAVPGDAEAWPMRLAYFMPGEDPDRPSFEIGILIHGNGV
ncbi:MAG: EipB family protein, partial [Alphaproteobacteria bacterium]